MEKPWKQAVAAVLLGVMAPQVILSASAWLVPGGQTPAPTEPTQMVQTQPTQGEEVQAPVFLPVLTGDITVRVMELENYVLGVVLAEMPASFEMEALKAQAVAARTYALRRIDTGDAHPDGAVCTDSGCCQAYISPEDYVCKRGTQADVERVSQAVQETAGLVLTFEGKLAESTYFSCSGGRTEDAMEVWGSDYPYLQAVDSPGEEAAASYRTEAFFTPEEFAGALGIALSGSPKSWLGRCTYTQGGGVKTMEIGGKTYTGTRLRKLLKLNSTYFRLTATDDGVAAQVGGRGHRVGMSQYGADAMAVTGKTYLEILAHYYAGTGIDKISAIG